MPGRAAYNVPKRFNEATFASYRPTHPSQVTAVRAARAYGHRIRDAYQASWWTRAWHQLTGPRKPLHGLYLVGPVGVGKTHLMAGLYHDLTDAGVPVAYLHSSALFRRAVPPPQMARAMAASYAVCCLDEVELDDPANEVRLVRFLQALSAEGVTLVATSNVEPEHFLSSMVGTDRFQHFLQEQFRQTYDVIVVEGEDYRRQLPSSGQAWIGPTSKTRPALQAVYEATSGEARWLEIRELLHATREIPHARLMKGLLSLDALFVHDITIRDTDDALRLLRVIDDLYTADDAPTFYFTTPEPPTLWFTVEDQHGKMAQGIAEKFSRTVSRLYALCDVQSVTSAAA